MDNEEEETSKLQKKPSVQVEHDSINIPTEAAATVMVSHDEGQRDTEPQCEPESVTGLSESEVQSQEQSLGEGKGVDEDSMVGEREAVAESEDSKLGGGGDVSCDSQLLITKVVGEENGDSIDGEEKRGVANSVDVTNGGDFVELVSVVGGGGEDEDIVGKERELADGAEEMQDEALVADVVLKEEKPDVAEEVEVVDGAEETEDEALVVDVELKEEKADVAEEVEFADKWKVVDVAWENEEKTGMQNTEIADEEKGAVVAVEMEIEDETKTVDVAEKTETGDDVAGEIDERDEMAEDEDIAGEMKVVDAAEEKETADVTKAANVAEETETADETKAVALAEEVDERAAMEEDREIGGEIKVVDTAEGNEIVKETDVADLAKETESAEDGKVAVVTETTTAGEVEVCSLAEETEMQDYETEFADVAGGETELVEEMEEATEMLEVTETEAEMAMGDLEEEAMDFAAEMGDKTDKADMVEEVSKTVGGKRKRVGKNSKPPGRVPPRKKSEEDVCFICFDGGDLVLCDRR